MSFHLTVVTAAIFAEIVAAATYVDILVGLIHVEI